MRLIITILVLGVLWANPSFAQTEGNLLRGAKTLYVAMDLFHTGKGQCSINREDIVSAYKFPFSNSNIVLPDTPVGSDLVLSININSMGVDQGGTLVGCAFSVDFKVTSSIVYAIPFNRKQWTFSAILFEVGSIHTSSVSGFRKDIRDTIEQYAKEFITDYNLDNK